MSWISGLAVVVVVGLAANLLGGLLARLFFKNRRLWTDVVLDEVSRLGLGLVALSYAILLLTAVRAVSSSVLWGFLTVLALLALLRLKQLFPVRLCPGRQSVGRRGQTLSGPHEKLRLCPPSIMGSGFHLRTLQARSAARPKPINRGRRT
ncbi:MAG: hypothetical protein MUP19_00890, partial [Candidatus Aminicenantes bacterium]|nr:hypothetical protein [Candidatus Aminicenantes bacterium]